VVLSVVFGLAFNVIGPVRFVAEQNVARAAADVEIDVEYLLGLGADAAPFALQSLGQKNPTGPPDVVNRVTDLVAAFSGLDDPGNNAWQAWNLSREKARELLGR